MYDVTIGRFVLQVADRVIANSNATASFVRHITNGRVRPQVIYRGIDYATIAAISPALDIKI